MLSVRTGVFRNYRLLVRRGIILKDYLKAPERRQVAFSVRRTTFHKGCHSNGLILTFLRVPKPDNKKYITLY